MALQDGDQFLVNRSGTNYKLAQVAIDTHNQTKNDARYAQLSGATLTGDLTFASGQEFPGGVVTGSQTTPERVISGSFDLSTGPYWVCDAVAIPNPTNAVAGMAGLIRFTATPTGWGSNFKFPGGTAVSPVAPAVVPFYVQDASTILVGNPVNGFA